ncbi:MAG: A/G-specific adenine glycosylase [Paracoccaceae bacterium]|jgi:A/G-specific adenine glycosylase
MSSALTQDEAAPEALSSALLAWYDRFARDLPWRIGPAALAAGVRPDPYRVWLSEIMLQQTTTAAAGPYFQRFTSTWPDVAALAGAEDADVMAAWAGLGYYARARNLLKCARAVTTDHGGVFPDAEDTLRTLPGIGPYTAAAVAAIAFDRPAVVVDGNIERVTARLAAVETPLPAAKPALYAIAATLTPQLRPGCHAQAMMDLGATICTPRNPACAICPLSHGCAARASGIAADLPKKAPKKPKPTRHGVAFVLLRDDGAVVLERRPDRGLLGGMLGLPGPEWSEDGPTPAAIAAATPCPANWRNVGTARHVFTHFALELEVRAAIVGGNAVPRSGQFHPDAEAQANALPTAMRKALDLALGATCAPKRQK